MKINECIIFRKEPDGSGMLFNPGNADIFALNVTSAFIWEQLTAGKGKDDILQSIKTTFKNIPDSVADEIDQFIEQLKVKGFVS